MSVKTKQAITKCLKKIEEGTFDEETIRSLLIICREHIKSNGLIKELAHFIAHSDRNQGMFHKKINNRYAKQKLIDDQMKAADVKKLNTEDELSDFLLGGISIYRIESKLFNILYADGLEDIPEAHLLKYTNLKRSEIKELFDRHYYKDKGFHYLNTLRTRTLIKKTSELKNMNEAQTLAFEEYKSHSELLIQKIELTIGQIQKVVRGVIYYTSVFDLETFNNEIATTLSDVINLFSIDQKFIKNINEHSKDILLCIMCLLHDSKFILYDKKEARNFLGFYLDPITDVKSRDHDKRTVYEDGVLALYTSGAGSTTFPLYVSDLPVKNYISADKFNKFKDLRNFSESLWITAERIDDRLQLVN